MTSREVLTVVLRVLAVWLFFRVLQVSADLVGLPGRSASPEMVAMTVLGSMVVAVGAVILVWLNATRIAGALLPREASAAGQTHMSAQEIKQTASFVLGLVLIATGLPTLAYWAAFIQRSTKVNPNGFNPSIEMYAGIVSVVVQVIVGGYLLLGSRGLVAMIRRLRGLPPGDAKEDREP